MGPPLVKPFKPGKHLSLAEQAKVAVQYADIGSGLYRKKRGSVQRLAWEWGCSTETLRNVYKHVKYGEDLDKPRPKGEHILDRPDLHAALIRIVVHRRGKVNKRKLAVQFFEETKVKVGANTIYRHLKEHDLQIKRRRYCPKLKEHHKVCRYAFGHAHHRQNWKHWIDVDEKWFYVVRIKGYVWILPGHMDPDEIKAIRVESKRYIQKIMYLVAVAKPLIAADGKTVLFSGKVGCWRVARLKHYAGDYNGKFKSHRAGDEHIVDVNMDAAMYVDMMVNKLLPAVKQLKHHIWDVEAGHSNYIIAIQHDGAPGHKARDIERRLNAAFAAVQGRFIRQPPKSPCTNMLDMAVFNSMAAYVAQHDYENKRDLHAAVLEAWDALPVSTLLMQWACKSVTMAQLIHHRGDEFKAAHPGLRKARAAGGFAGLEAKARRVVDGLDPIYPAKRQKMA